ncbi:MAG: family 20 glycosylhydrolase, partial [Oscillospiraceae bacterium]
MMVPIKLIGDIKEFEDGLQLILPDLSLEISDSGIPVTVQKGDSLVAKLSADSGCISYAKKVQFFRALSHLSQHGVGCNVEEQGGFEHNGVMIDLTCNNVMKPETLRYFFRKMALMGLDLAVIQQLMEVPEYPYYGYMRGRYSADEMKQIDDYAYTFGIEVVPCIQTLGHLERELHWNHMNPISDTPQVLFVGEDETYRFIEACLKAVTAPYRSKRVHIGMDEAWNVGFGKYLRKHGYRETADIMKDHLSRIHEILDRMGLHAMMWSDMYFRSISPTDDYYDLTAEIPQKILDSAPSDVDLVYWHYCETEENTYKEMIKRHQRFKAKTIYAGGICTWLGPTPRYDFTINPTVFALRQCRELGVSEVFATLWGDDCAEC